MANKYRHTDIPIIFISRKEDVNRRNYLKTECQKTARPYTIVDAKTPKSKRTMMMGQGFRMKEYRYEGASRELEIACFASHIKRLKYMIKNNIREAICAEDDIVFHKDFDHLFQEARDQIPEDTDAVYLTCMGEKPEKKTDKLVELREYTETFLWGAVMYWIRLPLARLIVARLDMPFRNTLLKTDVVTSELIPYFTIPMIANPLLAIEYPLFISTLRDKEIVKDFISYGYKNYLSQDVIDCLTKNHVEIKEDTSLDVLFHVIKRKMYKEEEKILILNLFKKHSLVPVNVDICKRMLRDMPNHFYDLIV